MFALVFLFTDRVKFITLINEVRLVPELGVSCLIAVNTLELGSIMASGLLLFNINGFGIVFLASNYRYQPTFSIIPTRLLIIILIESGLLGFTICVPTVILGI